jgi:hypothetical protein
MYIPTPLVMKVVYHRPGLMDNGLLDYGEPARTSRWKSPYMGQLFVESIDEAIAWQQRALKLADRLEKRLLESHAEGTATIGFSLYLASMNIPLDNFGNRWYHRALGALAALTAQWQLPYGAPKADIESRGGKSVIQYTPPYLGRGEGAITAKGELAVQAARGMFPGYYGNYLDGFECMIPIDQWRGPSIMQKARLRK